MWEVLRSGRPQRHALIGRPVGVVSQTTNLLFPRGMCSAADLATDLCDPPSSHRRHARPETPFVVQSL